jgi:hypothetical protein
MFLPLLTGHAAALHGDRATDGCEADTKFADESVRLTADNVPDDGK